MSFQFFDILEMSSEELNAELVLQKWGKKKKMEITLDFVVDYLDRCLDFLESSHFLL